MNTANKILYILKYVHICSLCDYFGITLKQFDRMACSNLYSKKFKKEISYIYDNIKNNEDEISSVFLDYNNFIITLKFTALKFTKINQTFSFN